MYTCNSLLLLKLTNYIVAAKGDVGYHTSSLKILVLIKIQVINHMHMQFPFIN